MSDGLQVEMQQADLNSLPRREPGALLGTRTEGLIRTAAAEHIAHGRRGSGLAGGRASTGAEARDPVDRSRSEDASLPGQGRSRMARKPPTRRWSATTLKDVNGLCSHQRFRLQLLLSW